MSVRFIWSQVSSGPLFSESGVSLKSPSIIVWFPFLSSDLLVFAEYIYVGALMLSLFIMKL